MKKFFLTFLVIALTVTACKTTPKEKPDTKPEKAVSTQGTETTASSGGSEKTGTAETSDGAPTYLYSENDRTKPFTKVGAGTGTTGAKLNFNESDIKTPDKNAKAPAAKGSEQPEKKVPATDTISDKKGTQSQTDQAESKNNQQKKDTGTTKPQAPADTNKPQAPSDTSKPKITADTNKPQTPSDTKKSDSKPTQPAGSNADQTKLKTKQTKQDTGINKPANPKQQPAKPAANTGTDSVKPGLPPKTNQGLTQENKKDTEQPEVKQTDTDAEQPAADNTNIKPDNTEYFSEFPDDTVNYTEEIPVSRTASVHKNQRLRVVYPGEKWVFLGEQTAQKGLNYEQRRFQNGDTEFTFYAKEQGNYILHFSRYDAYTNSFIKDALAVEVGEKNTSAPSYVKAPAYTLPTGESSNDAIHTLKPVQPAASETSDIRSNQAHAEEKPAVEKTVKNSNELETVDLLERAKTEIAQGDAASAIKDLNQCIGSGDERLDEAYFYLGQAYEMNGAEKNIKSAFSAYKYVTSNFPESDFWQKSDERMRYIKRFYVNIE